MSTTHPRRALLALLCLLATSPLAHAEQCRPEQAPWVAHGTVHLQPNTLVDDPPPNVVGLRGEVAEVPYVVPEGKELIVTSVGLSGNKLPQAAVILWVGDYPADNSKTIPATDSGWSSAHAPAMNSVLPSGLVLHVRVANGSPVPNTYAWYVFGCLASAP